MPNGDPRGGFFYPTLTLVMDSHSMYNFQHEGIMDIIQDCTDVGKLSCANISQRQPSILNWPGSRSKPTAFCHIDEAVEVVSQSGYGEQQGIINETEVDFVVCPMYQFIRVQSTLHACR